MFREEAIQNEPKQLSAWHVLRIDWLGSNASHHVYTIKVG